MDVRLPDGTVIKNVPEGTTKAELTAKLQANGYDVAKLTTPAVAPEEKPKEYAGFFGSMGESSKTLLAAKAAHAWELNPTEENRKAFLDATKSDYEHVGFGEGHNFEALKELVGGSVGAELAPLGIGIGASAVGTPIAGVAARNAARLEQYNIGILQRRAEEDEKAIAEGRAPEGPHPVKAGVGAALETGADIYLESKLKGVYKAIPFVKHLLVPETKAAGKAAAGALADAVQQGTIKVTAGGIAKGVGRGIAIEVPQEVFQQASERFGAGLSLTDEDAIKEYYDAAKGAAILGGAFGGANEYLEARSKGKEDESKAKAKEVLGTTAPAVEAAENEQEIKGSPEYVATVRRYMDEHKMPREQAERIVSQLEEFKNEPKASSAGVPPSGVDNTGNGAGVSVPSGPSTGGGAAPRRTARSRRRSWRASAVPGRSRWNG